MELHDTTDIIFQRLSKGRFRSRRAKPLFDDLSSVRQELRECRKHFLGSYISLESLVQSSSGINEKIVFDLSHYLAVRTVLFWNQDNPFAKNFCTRFYNLAIYAIGSGDVGNESVDDIIQLAECLVRSRDVFGSD